MSVRIYTDGACLANRGGAGGWAFKFRMCNLLYLGKGSALKTTNNAMELLAAIKGLECFMRERQTKQIPTIVSDSRYVVDGASVWLPRWKRRNWMSANNMVVKNLEHWKKIDEICSFIRVDWEWVRGHDGNTLNAEVDRMAQSEALYVAGELIGPASRKYSGK